MYYGNVRDGGMDGLKLKAEKGVEWAAWNTNLVLPVNSTRASSTANMMDFHAHTAKSTRRLVCRSSPLVDQLDIGGQHPLDYFKTRNPVIVVKASKFTFWPLWWLSSPPVLFSRVYNHPVTSLSGWDQSAILWSHRQHSATAISR